MQTPQKPLIGLCFVPQGATEWKKSLQDLISARNLTFAKITLLFAGKGTPSQDDLSVLGHIPHEAISCPNGDGLIAAANRVIRSAQSNGYKQSCDLLFRNLSSRLQDGTLAQLAAHSELDEKIGFLIPRTSEKIAEKDYALVQPLSAQFTLIQSTSGAHTVWITSAVLNQILPLDTQYQDLDIAFADYSGRANRAGFRTLVVLSGFESRRAEGDPSESKNPDLALLCKKLPEIDAWEKRNILSPTNVLESLLLEATKCQANGSYSLLLDACNLPGIYNGTSEWILAALGALHETQSQFEVTIRAGKEGVEFHKLRERFPKFGFHEEGSDRKYFACVRMSQPWETSELDSLARSAYFNFVVMLDTIAWDAAYIETEQLGRVWKFTGDQMDGLLFISKYTRDRFAFRFPINSTTAEFIYLLSVDARDYAPVAPKKGPATPVLVVGNGYFHKNIEPTINALKTIFPFEKFQVLGGKTLDAAQNVELISSGSMSPEIIEGLFSSCKALVFPSLYEGFGFPMIRGLSCGKHVFAQESSLSTELMAQYSGPGTLVLYKNMNDLGSKLSRFLEGVELDEHEITRSSINPKDAWNWKRATEHFVRFLEASTQDLQASKARSRLNAIEDARIFHKEDALHKSARYDLLYANYLGALEECSRLRTWSRQLATQLAATPVRATLKITHIAQKVPGLVQFLSKSLGLVKKLRANIRAFFRPFRRA